MTVLERYSPDFGAVWLTYFPTHMIELYSRRLHGRPTAVGDARGR